MNFIIKKIYNISIILNKIIENNRKCLVSTKFLQPLVQLVSRARYNCLRPCWLQSNVWRGLYSNQTTAALSPVSVTRAYLLQHLVQFVKRQMERTSSPRRAGVARVHQRPAVERRGERARDAFLHILTQQTYILYIIIIIIDSHRSLKVWYRPFPIFWLFIFSQSEQCAKVQKA